MTFHPAVFNLTVVDPSLYPGLHGGQHPFFQAPQQPQNPHLPPHLPNRVPGAAPGLPSQHLEGGAEDTQFQTFVHSLPSELQGPIAFRNDTRQAPFAKPRPVIPRLAIPAISNSTFVQLPVLWTALSLALGVEVQGEVIRGLPCIKRLNQLFCRTPGNSYPSDKIERFIEDNKALMRRMYGSFFDNIQEILEPQQQRRFLSRPGRSVREDEAFADEIPEIHKEYHPDDPRGQSFFNLIRRKRQSFPGDANSNSDRVDSCESKVEIVTPYWANNSAGKIRAIVNTNEFSQAIHQEVCASKQSTKRCGGDCGCEQKYKWHRLLAYDPDNDCSGIFMDWFLFPSCCSCRCNPL